MLAKRISTLVYPERPPLAAAEGLDTNGISGLIA
jgi:hypothetical protein